MHILLALVLVSKPAPNQLATLPEMIWAASARRRQKDAIGRAVVAWLRELARGVNATSAVAIRKEANQ